MGPSGSAVAAGEGVGRTVAAEVGRSRCGTVAADRGPRHGRDPAHAQPSWWSRSSSMPAAWAISWITVT